MASFRMPATEVRLPLFPDRRLAENIAMEGTAPASASANT
jgi:hypothetical protein